MKFLQTVLLIALCAVYCMADYSFDNLVVRRMPPPDSKLTQGDVRVLVILVEFADVRFKNPDPVSQFTDYLNKEGYNEYHNIGSVRDYFIKNSMGKFRPIFDVYGPVTLPGMRDSYGTTINERDYTPARLAVSQALDSLLKLGVDFSQYDKDGDGCVEYVFMVYAGIAGMNLSNEKTIWPHAGYFGEPFIKKTGKKVDENLFIDRYACANEISLKAYERDKSTSVLNGIGVFVHEFSHLFGFPDFYSTSGNKTLGSWSVMDDGSHNCPSNGDFVENCTPPLYSAFERMSMGWFTPIEIKNNGKIQLNKLDDNIAYSITNPENPDEMYLLEYRTNKGWDIGQESSGMLIWHIDYVDSNWHGNLVNGRVNHMHVDIIEAAEDPVDVLNSETSPYDVFPGKGNVTEFKDFVFWNGLDMNITLSDITETPDKEYVTFNLTMGEPFMRALSSSSSLLSSSSFDVFPVLSSGLWTPYSSPLSFVREDSIISIASSKTSMRQASVISQNGTVHVTTPLQGLKKVRMFSPNGQLLYETSMDGTELQFPWPRHLGAQNVILTVSQGKKNLYMGIVNGH